ncbi:MAG: hypothetical protein ACR2M4_12470 [Actinomycetota bacterium]
MAEGKAVLFIYVSVDLHRDIRYLADQRETSMAAVARRALINELKAEGIWSDRNEIQETATNQRSEQ